MTDTMHAGASTSCQIRHHYVDSDSPTSKERIITGSAASQPIYKNGLGSDAIYSGPTVVQNQYQDLL